MDVTDLLTLLFSFAALFIPVILVVYERNSKLRKAVYLKELIKTRDDLEQMAKEANINGQQILHQKLELMLSDIDKEINESKGVVSRRLELISLGAISFLLVFISMRLHGNGSSLPDEINEGIFTYSLSKGLFSFILIMFSFSVSNVLAKILKLNNQAIAKIALLVTTYIVVYFTSLSILKLLDRYSNLF